MYATAATKK